MEIIAEIVSEYDYPVAFNFPAGHIDNNNTIILGQTAKLEMTHNNSNLTFC